MKGDLGTILYIVFLILISVAGMFKKKKKVDVEERKKRMMQQRAAARGEVLPQEEPVAEEPRFTTGNPLVDALLGGQDEETPYVRQDAPAHDPVNEVLPEEEKEPEEFLPREEEGKSVFTPAASRRDNIFSEKNRIVADHPDWEKFMDEQAGDDTPEFLKDFDPVKAIIYSEIMERKFF